MGKAVGRLHMSSKLEAVLLFAAFFTILTSNYGLSSTIPDVQSATNTIFGPWPAPSFPVLTNCSSTDLVCIFKTANAAAAYPGIALLYGFSLLYSAATRINAMMAIFQSCCLEVPFKLAACRFSVS